jgi:hypothetical protein
MLHTIGPYLVLGFVAYCVYVVPCIFMALSYYKIGREPLWLYLVLSLLFTPIVTWLVLIFVPPNENVLDRRKKKLAWRMACPYCAEQIAYRAIYCKHCHSNV